ncbi:MAG: hypothetical protein CME59_16835 [Halioglobus sp.]|nr:hypothetical protein [Halioglobus sp.]
MQDSQRRRFIAGAVCPQCGVLDRIVVDQEADRLQCVSCGFEQERPSAPAPQEPRTRVSRAAARRVETPAEAVTLVDPREPDEP